MSYEVSYITILHFIQKKKKIIYGPLKDKFQALPLHVLINMKATCPVMTLLLLLEVYGPKSSNSRQLARPCIRKLIIILLVINVSTRTLS